MPIGHTVLVQREDNGPWMHGKVVEHGSRDHHNKSYKIHMTKTSHIITRTTHCVEQTPISTEQDLHDDITKVKNLQPDDDFDRLVNAYSVAYVKTTSTKHIPNDMQIIAYTMAKTKAYTALKHKHQLMHYQ